MENSKQFQKNFYVAYIYTVKWKNGDFMNGHGSVTLNHQSDNIFTELTITSADIADVTNYITEHVLSNIKNRYGVSEIGVTILNIIPLAD